MPVSEEAGKDDKSNAPKLHIEWLLGVAPVEDQVNQADRSNKENAQAPEDAGSKGGNQKGDASDEESDEPQQHQERSDDGYHT